MDTESQKIASHPFIDQLVRHVAAKLGIEHIWMKRVHDLTSEICDRDQAVYQALSEVLDYPDRLQQEDIESLRDLLDSRYP